MMIMIIIEMMIIFMN